MDKQSEIIIYTQDNGLEEMKPLFNKLWDNKIGHLKPNYYCIPVTFKLNSLAIQEFGKEMVQKFNTMQYQAEQSRYHSACYSFAIKLNQETKPVEA